MLITFSMSQIVWDHLWCLLNMIKSYQDILQLTVFCFCRCYFYIQYNCYSKNYYTYWFIIILLLLFTLKKIFDISKYYIFSSFKYFFYLKPFLISLILFYSSGLKLSVIKYFEKKKIFFKSKSLLCFLKKHSIILSLR